jgi:pyruvate dehydrogenase E2 component (dihydrolipoamide acetyltransferase)
MPALSPTMTEGSINKWLIKVGDQVKAGDVIAEIETDKATMEVESVDEGVVTKLLFKEGDSAVAVNSTIAILDGSDEEFENDNVKKDEILKNDYKSKEVVIKKEKLDDSLPKDKIIQNNYLAQKTILSPYVRNVAKKEGINLENISGSGPNGRIIKRDLENNNNEFLSTIKTDNKIIIPNSIRKIIAKKTTFTKQTVPHFYLSIESNVDKLIEMRKRINSTSDIKVSLNDIFIKALALAQKANPLTNVSWIEGKIIQYRSVDVSIAVALKEGLITPIIKDADSKGIKKISKEIKELVDKANKGKLLPDEYTGGTISISNLGMFGIDEFSAIINPPQSSILAIGSIKSVPGFVNGEIKEINVLKSTLSADHRVLDGVVAGKLLKDFNDIIEEPFNLWLMSEDMEII